MTSTSTRNSRRLISLVGLSIAGAIVAGACGTTSPIAQYRKEHQIDDDNTTVVRGTRDTATGAPMPPRRQGPHRQHHEDLHGGVGATARGGGQAPAHRHRRAMASGHG